MRKIYITIFVIVLSIILYAGYLYFKNTTGRDALSVMNEMNNIQSLTETANWKTYENSKWFISFKYPPNKELIESGLPGGQSNPSHYPYPILEVESTDAMNGNGFNFLSTTDDATLNFNFRPPKDALEKVINGQHWKIAECKSGADILAMPMCLYSITYYLSYNGRIHKFSFKYDPQEDPWQEQVISSFRHFNDSCKDGGPCPLPKN